MLARRDTRLRQHMRNSWYQVQVLFPNSVDFQPASGIQPEDELIAEVSSLYPVLGSYWTTEESRGVCHLYLEEESDAEALREHLVAALKSHPQNPEVSHPLLVPRENWHEGWRQYFKPVEVGERLLVVPPWEAEEAGRTSDRVILIAEPGMAFGTGTHETTQLCLRYAEELVQGAARVLDIGTGSGILGIAALKLGASYCLGVDNDPEVRENVADNLRLNDVPTAKFELMIGLLDQIAPQPFNLIFCNMLMHEFWPVLPQLRDYLAEDGLALVSGFLEQERGAVEGRLTELGYLLSHPKKAGEWGSIAAGLR